MSFWKGFQKRAYDTVQAKKGDRGPRQAEKPLSRSVPADGPRLDQITTKAQQGQYRFFKG